MQGLVASAGVLATAEGNYELQTEAEVDRIQLLREMVQSHREDLLQSFREVDVDKSGSLDANELKLVLRNFNIELEATEFDDLLLQIDSDNDGEISYVEFMGFFGKGQGELQPLSLELGDAIYYEVDHVTEEREEITIAEIAQLYNAGSVTGETLVWAEGMDDWMPYEQARLLLPSGASPRTPKPDATLVTYLGDDGEEVESNVEDFTKMLSEGTLSADTQVRSSGCVQCVTALAFLRK
jgi:hypothetical protein